MEEKHVSKPIHQLPQMPGAQLPTERARNVAFVKRLRQLMADRDWTQSDVAAEIWGRTANAKGASVAKGRDRLSVWISGKNFPDRENLEKLARALQVEVGDLSPEAELKIAHHGAADWSMTAPADGTGRVFVQIAQFLPQSIAHKIHGLLLEAEELRNQNR